MNPVRKFSVPNPCTQDFNSMTPAGEGRHCMHCDKTVIDFRNYSTSELQDFFLKKDPSTHVCGIIKKRRLEELVIPVSLEDFYSKRTYGWQKFILVFAVCFSTSLFSCSEGSPTDLRPAIKVALTVSDHELKMPVAEPEPEAEKEQLIIWDDDIMGDIVPIVETVPPDTPVEPIIQFEPDMFPEIPMGEQVLLNYFAENIRYPERERERGIEGTVYVQFEIDREGKAINPKILKSVKGAQNFDAEVLRVIDEMPRWPVPKYNRAFPTNIFTLPVKFRLE